MLSSNSLYYKESGKAPLLGVLRLLIVGSLVAFFAGLAYAFAIYAIAFVGFDFLLTLVYGFILGFAVGLSAHSGKIRNKKVVMGGAVFVGLLAGYFVWVFTIYTRFGGGLVFNPQQLLSIILEMAKTGSWSILGMDLAGRTLYVLWTLEALLILSVTSLIASIVYGSTPFCEDCEEWTTAVELSSRLAAPENIDSFVVGLESKDYDRLTGLKNVDVTSPKKMKVEVLECPNCSKNHYLNLTLIKRDEDKKETKESEPKEDGELIVENLELSEHVYKEIIEWSKKLNAPPDFLVREN